MKEIFTFDFLKKLHQQLQLREIKGLPEQIAFNLVMSIVPLLVIIVQVGTYFSLSTDIVEYLIVSYAPEELQALLTALFQTPPPTNMTNFLLITTMITFFWLTSKGFYGISSAANITYQVPRMKFAYIERLFAFLIVCLMVVVLVTALIIYVFGQGILVMTFDFLDLILDESYILIFNFAKQGIGFTAYFIFFLFMFYFSPSRKMKFRNVLPGALLTALIWTLTSVGFSYYVNTIAQYSKFYGSLSVIIILLFWLYLLGYMIVIGLQINYLLERDSKTGITYEPRVTIKPFNLSEFMTEES